MEGRIKYTILDIDVDASINLLYVYGRGIASICAHIVLHYPCVKEVAKVSIQVF